MFYSHQLLARKAPLGQIWMAATMHVKMNRRKLDRINIINICEEILNPSVPMALRLSGILMGGVVIVYERKVKLFYEDVTRLLVEINQAWKVKPVQDPTLLPKGKSQAKYEAVTLPDNHESELGGIEHSLQYSNSNTVIGLQQTAYFNMRLDQVDESLVNCNSIEENQAQDNHQADYANITITDEYQPNTNFCNDFQRFDIEEDERMQMNSNDHVEIPILSKPSPLCEDGPQKPDEIQEQHPGLQVNQQSDEDKETVQVLKRQEQPRRGRKRPAFYMDYEQTIIPGHMYQSWLQMTSDIVSRNGRKRKPMGTTHSMKIARLMELPPVGLACGLFSTGNQEMSYPAPLFKLWMRSSQPPQDSPSGRSSPQTPPETSLSSPPERLYNHGDPIGHADKDGFKAVETQRRKVNSFGMPVAGSTEELRTVFENIGIGVADANENLYSGNSGDDMRSIHSSGSGGRDMPYTFDVNVGGPSKKRPFPSSRHSVSSLETVDEYTPLPEIGIDGITGIPETTQENDQLMETGPTQTPYTPVIKNQPLEQITKSIHTQLKVHFDTPGAAQDESLNQLVLGMNRRRAACLFYQTLVLATRDIVKVQQKVPYGDIFISRGKMM